MTGIIEKIEQEVVRSEVISLTKKYVEAGDITDTDRQTLADAAWVIVSLGLILYGRAAAQGA